MSFSQVLFENEEEYNRKKTIMYKNIKETIINCVVTDTFECPSIGPSAENTVAPLGSSPDVARYLTTTVDPSFGLRPNTLSPKINSYC